MRVLADGAWGFAATSRVEAVAAARAAERAIGIAKANAKLVARRIELARVSPYNATWSTDLHVDPFQVPLGERIDLLFSIWRDASAVPEVKHGDGAVELLGEWRLFASTEGSRVEQSITRLAPSFGVTAIDVAKGDFVTRRHEIAPRQAGWEYVTGSTFRTGEGLPLKRIAWVDRGVVASFAYSRYWAAKQGKQPTGKHASFLLRGGTAARTEDLLTGIKRGLLVTRFWYTRWLEPRAMSITGLTRDGVFLIEDGRVTAPVNNFRFNDSPANVLANCDAMKAATIRVPDSDVWRVPAIRTHDFNMASVSAAV